MHKLSAHRATIYWVLIVLIFFIPYVSGCGGSGGGFDGSTGFWGTERSGTSNGKTLEPKVFSTPSNPIYAPGVNRTPSSPPTKTLKASSIPIPAGSTITIKSYSSDAAATNMFGYFDPLTGTEEVLTSDCPASVQAGEVFGPFGPYDNDVTMVFWFYSTWTGSPGKIMIESVDSTTYNIGCEDWDDDDYNDYIAQVTIEPSSNISIKNAKATPEKFNPSFNLPDNQSIISASIVAKEGFSAETISWNIVINNSNGLVNSFPDRIGSPGVGPWNVSEVWDGKNDSGVFAGAGEYTFKITATATANGETVQKSASGKVTIVDNKLKIIDASIVPSYASPGQTIILNYKVVTYPENWEPPLRSWYGVLNSSNDILVAANLQPTSYGCTAIYKDVPVTIPSNAENGMYKVQITAYTYAITGPDGRPLSAEPVELALDIGTGSTQKKLKISNLKIVPIKKNGDEIAECLYPGHDPDFYPVGGEKLKFTGTIETDPPGGNPANLGWRIQISNLNTGEYVEDSNLHPDSEINFTWTEPFSFYYHTKGVFNGIMEDISNPRTYRYVIQACCTDSGFEPIQKEVFGQSIGFEIPVEPMYQNDPNHPEQWSDPIVPINGYVGGLYDRPIQTYGCLLTCYAMILNKYHISATPISINAYLLNLRKLGYHGAFNFVGNPSFNAVFLKYALDNSNGLRYFNYQNLLLYNDIEFQYESNNPIVVCIDTTPYYLNKRTGHAIIGKGICRPFNFGMQDPWYACRLFSTFFDCPSYNFNNVAILSNFAAVPMDFSHPYVGSISINAGTFTDLTEQNDLKYTENPLIELCITDSSGKKLGYVNSTKGEENTVQNIPGGSYGIESSMGGTYFSCKTMNINNPNSGNYSFQIIGKQSCGYELEIEVVDKSLGRNYFRDTIGIISQGITHTYRITIDSDNANAFKLAKTITPGETKNSLQTAFDLNWIDNRGILNSLTKKLENADAAYAKGKIKTAVNELNAFINDVNAQKGKHIKSKAADMLIYDAEAYIKQLQP